MQISRNLQVGNCWPPETFNLRCHNLLDDDDDDDAINDDDGNDDDAINDDDVYEDN